MEEKNLRRGVKPSKKKKKWLEFHTESLRDFMSSAKETKQKVRKDCEWEKESQRGFLIVF